MIQTVQRGLFVTGTDTGVGKTRIGVELIKLLRQRNQCVRSRKPVESGCQTSDGRLIPEDAQALQTAAGNYEALATVCRYRFTPALSPERAAALTGRSLSLADLKAACLQDVEKDDFLLVEGAGGFYSPIASGALNADLAAELALPVLLVAADKLGVINHTLLTVEAIKRRGLHLAGVVLNRFMADIDPGMDNPAELSRWLGCPVTVTFRYDSDADLARLGVFPTLSALADRLASGL